MWSGAGVHGREGAKSRADLWNAVYSGLFLLGLFLYEKSHVRMQFAYPSEVEGRGGFRPEPHTQAKS